MMVLQPLAMRVHTAKIPTSPELLISLMQDTVTRVWFVVQCEWVRRGIFAYACVHGVWHWPWVSSVNTFFAKTGSLPEPGTHCFNLDDWPVRPWICLSLYPQPPLSNSYFLIPEIQCPCSTSQIFQLPSSALQTSSPATPMQLCFS